MKKIIFWGEYLFKAWVDYTFRLGSVGMRLINVGVIVLSLVLAGWAFDISFPLGNGSFHFSFNADSGVAERVMYGLLVIGILLVLFGAFRVFQESALADRRRAIVIELRGLRDWNGAPLVEALPRTVRARRESVFIDVRQGLIDGGIVSPGVALRHLEAVRPRIDAIENGLDRRDIAYFVGGLGPVPFTFLLGVLIDDETPVTLYDWDRSALLWREVQGPDDGHRFAVDGLEQVCQAKSSDVVVEISASYEIDHIGVSAKFGQLPRVTLDLVHRSTDSHWSLEKQRALAAQFLDVMRRLGGAGVQTVHLFFAGPASLVLRCGMAYDRRNLPKLTLYQYERSAVPPFPWGVTMPVGGEPEVKIVQ